MKRIEPSLINPICFSNISRKVKIIDFINNSILPIIMNRSVTSCNPSYFTIRQSVLDKLAIRKEFDIIGLIDYQIKRIAVLFDIEFIAPPEFKLLKWVCYQIIYSRWVSVCIFDINGCSIRPKSLISFP